MAIGLGERWQVFGDRCGQACLHVSCTTNHFLSTVDLRYGDVWKLRLVFFWKERETVLLPFCLSSWQRVYPLPSEDSLSAKTDGKTRHHTYHGCEAPALQSLSSRLRTDVSVLSLYIYMYRYKCIVILVNQSVLTRVALYPCAGISVVYVRLRYRVFRHLIGTRWRGFWLFIWTGHASFLFQVRQFRQLSSLSVCLPFCL